MLFHKSIRERCFYEKNSKSITFLIEFVSLQKYILSTNTKEDLK